MNQKELEEDLEIQLKNISDPISKVDKLIEFSRILLFSNTIKSLDYLEEAYSLSLKYQSKREQINILFLKAYSKTNLGMYDKAIIDFMYCKEYALSSKNEDLFVKIMGNIATIFLELGIVNQAIFIFKDLMKNHTPKEDKSMYYKHLINLIYTYQKIYKSNNKTKVKIQEVLDFSEESGEKHIDLYCMAHISMALYYKEKNEYPQSLLHFEKVIDINGEDELNIQNYRLFIDVALVYGEMKQLKKEYIFLKKALRISKKHHLDSFNLIIYERLSVYYKSIHKFELALECFEKFHICKIKEEQELFKTKKALEKLNLTEQDSYYQTLMEDYIKSSLFSSEQILLIEDIDDKTIELEIEKIVCVNVEEDILNIYLTDNQVFKIRQKFKDFTDNLYSRAEKKHLFFFTNQRSELVNLFWLSRIDKIEKMIYLNVVGQEYNYRLTRSQFANLKEFLKI
jgi:tetratricopeptide (TPR) repeat protein